MLSWSELYRLRFYHSVFEIVIGIFSYIINFLLIYMAMYKSSRYMRAYRVIIVMNSCVDLFYNTISICIQVVSLFCLIPLIKCFKFKVVDMKDGGLFFMSGYFLENLPQPYACYLHNFWMFGLLLSVLNIPGWRFFFKKLILILIFLVQFIFRYCILCKNRVLTGKELFIMLAIPAFFVALHCCYGVKAYLPSAEQTKELLPVLQKDPLWQKDTPVFSYGSVVSQLIKLFVLNKLFRKHSQFKWIFVELKVL